MTIYNAYQGCATIMNFCKIILTYGTQFQDMTYPLISQAYIPYLTCSTAFGNDYIKCSLIKRMLNKAVSISTSVTRNQVIIYWTLPYPCYDVLV